MNEAITTASPRTLRDFGLVMAGMIAGLFGLLLPLLKSRSLPLTPWLIALVFASFALIYPRGLSLVYRWWMKLGHILGAINSRIILSVLFWGIVTPLSLLFKLARRDTLKLRDRDPNTPTYRIPSAEHTPKQGMEKPF
jgi:hypothetical protein